MLFEGAEGRNGDMNYSKANYIEEENSIFGSKLHINLIKIYRE